MRCYHPGGLVVPGHILHGGLHWGAQVLFYLPQTSAPSHPPKDPTTHPLHRVEGQKLFKLNAPTDRHDSTQQHRRCPSPSSSYSSDASNMILCVFYRLKNAEISGYDASSHYGSLTGITFAEVKSSSFHRHYNHHYNHNCHNHIAFQQMKSSL